MTYFFEPSVLDVELLGVNKVKQFSVLLSKRKREIIILAEIH